MIMHTFVCDVCSNQFREEGRGIRMYKIQITSSLFLTSTGKVEPMGKNTHLDVCTPCFENLGKFFTEKNGWDLELMK